MKTSHTRDPTSKHSEDKMLHLSIDGRHSRSRKYAEFIRPAFSLPSISLPVFSFRSYAFTNGHEKCSAANDIHTSERLNIHHGLHETVQYSECNQRNQAERCLDRRESSSTTHEPCIITHQDTDADTDAARSAIPIMERSRQTEPGELRASELKRNIRSSVGKTWKILEP